MLGVNMLLHITSAISLAMLYKQYQDVMLLLNTREDMEQLVTSSDDVKTVLHNYQRESHTGGHGEHVIEDGSSVYCTGNDHTNRLCHFKNLCYLPSVDQFVFLHSQSSVIEGVPTNRFNPALLDMSSVANHNKQYFNYIDIPASKASDLLHGMKIIEQQTLVFKRFNPSNIMHVFHDDLLPLQHTLQLITMGKPLGTTGRYDIQLVFMDNAEPDSFDALYELFSLYKPITKRKLLDENKSVCFKDVYVGISKTTTWYHYGFFIPQGPIMNSNATALHILNFSRYLKTQLKVMDEERAHDLTNQDSNSPLAVVFTRKFNRLILNEVDLIATLAQKLHVKVVTLSLETHSLKEIIKILGVAKFLIGMHGSILILSMFLPPEALVVELFPYAVNPENYTPYKTLAGLPGIWIKYKAWRNMDKTRSVTHPQSSWEHGGIHHLSLEVQEKIEHSEEVPQHLCCRDPEWLYRIYQDTYIDIEAVVSLIEHHIAQSKFTNHHTGSDEVMFLVNQRLLPGLVVNIRCDNILSTTEKSERSKLLLSLTFSPPFNLQYLDYLAVEYEVWLQEVGTDDILAWILSRTTHDFMTGLKPYTEYLIWVRCILDGQLQGPFSTDPIKCHTS